MTPMYILLLVMTLMGSFASYFLKIASGACGLRSLMGNYNLYLGGGLYFLSALINIYLLRYLDFSVVLPLTSLTYAWTIFISAALLKEKITWQKLVGTASIVVGAVLVSL